MNHKEMISFILIAAAAITGLAACSGAVTPPSQPPYSGEPVREEAPREAEEPAEEESREDIAQEAVPEESRENAGTPDGFKEELVDKHVRLRLDGSGRDVFALWGSGRPDYRYGPSMICNDDGSIDAWFASPGDSKKEYDWITYRHSKDGGQTWDDERVVLSPTPGSADFKSVCDPDVFYYDGYYYMGYTGTINDDGLCNSVFLARSENPDGPFEKWDGGGWSGLPVPIVYFDGIEIGWGAGEPSFVAVDDTLYVYNTLDSFSDIYGWVRATEVRTADLTDPLWPGKLEFGGITVFRSDFTDANEYTYSDSDSWDVAYLEDSHKFIALATNRRFKDDSCLLYYESYDGINFDRVSELNTDVISGCHNCGIMTDPSGHIGKDDRSMIGYAYSGTGASKWGVWATRIAPVIIDYTDEIDRSDEGSENLKQKISIDESLLGNGPIMLLTDRLTYTTEIESPLKLKCYLMNTYRQKTRISTEEVKIEKYDRDFFKLSEDGRLVPVREGMSIVGLEYNGLRRDICICVLPDDNDESRITDFYPVSRGYDVSVKEPIILKVRPMAVFGDYDIHELSGYEINAYDIHFSSGDLSVCRVEKDGTIKIVAPGQTVITVEGENCRYTLDINVRE
ncbi:MAG: exo-alpha-sialidase [Lachnospiraceae bacterium]|nr:exo-alpha-sialidase [Lachnospiraceae bacterium]